MIPTSMRCVHPCSFVVFVLTHPPNVQDPDNLKCRWYHKVLFDIIRSACFDNARAVGFLNTDLFYPIPLETIALAATAVRAILVPIYL